MRGCFGQQPYRGAGGSCPPFPIPAGGFAVQGGGPDLDRGAHVCVAGQKLSLEQRLRVEGPNFGSLQRPGGHPPHALLLQ